jgi:hypothetical protein
MKPRQFVAASAHLDCMITGPLNLNAKLNEKEVIVLLSSFPAIVEEYISYFPQYQELFLVIKEKLAKLFDFMDNTYYSLLEEVRYKFCLCLYFTVGKERPE